MRLSQGWREPLAREERMLDVRRREFIALLGGAAAAWPIVARAQQPQRKRRIGVVMAYAESDPNGHLQVAAFRQQLQKLGWTEGSNIQIDFRYAADDPTRIRALAVELLRLGPDLLVSNSNFVTTILQSEVHSLPLVFVSVSDPIGSGFVKDLARPGGNVTGFANFQPSMGGKWLEELREIAPQVERIGLMLHPEPPNIGYLKSAEAAAPSLKIKLVGLEVRSSAEIERAFATFAGEPHSGLVIAPNVVTFANSNLIVALAARYRLPAIYPFAFYAKAGGLISYGFDAADQFRQGAVYADKILRGAKPADLPVQHPTKFEMVVNLKTANALGLDVPLHLQQLADEVIE
jgi:putative tryptophan/tyrosine transport system substrate-binding protein